MSQKPLNRASILLMTATITPPNGVPELVRVDPHLRLQDYQHSLKFYLSLLGKSIDAIVFAENSNSHVASLKELVKQANAESRVEFLVFDGLDYPSSYGRAYGEFKLIEYAVQHSQMIANNSQAIVWKVTGRYIIKNLTQIVARQPAKFDFYCNFRTIPKRWADMYLLAWTHQGYQTCVEGMYPKLKSNYEVSPLHPEEVYINLLEESANTICLVCRLNPAPWISGIRGSDNQGYLKGTKLLQSYIRRLGRVLFPWLWI